MTPESHLKNPSGILLLLHKKLASLLGCLVECASPNVEFKLFYNHWYGLIREEFEEQAHNMELYHLSVLNGICFSYFYQVTYIFLFLIGFHLPEKSMYF